jgi:hypothetical protein
MPSQTTLKAWQLKTLGREANALRVRLSPIETPFKNKMLEHMDELLRLIRYAENEQDGCAKR